MPATTLLPSRARRVVGWGSSLIVRLAAACTVVSKCSIVIASVGQRSAHSPQRMQWSSSFTITTASAPAPASTRSYRPSAWTTLGLTNERQAWGHTSVQRPQAMQRSPS